MDFYKTIIKKVYAAKVEYNQPIISDIFDSINKLCIDRFLSDRYINSLWNNIDDCLLKIALMDRDIPIYVINDLLNLIDDCKEIAVENEEYEAAKNIQRFHTIMVDRVKKDMILKGEE